ncbi:MAG: hypothetical protein AAFX04_08130 [Pseudomonadota bacterium]
MNENKNLSDLRNSIDELIKKEVRLRQDASFSTDEILEKIKSQLHTEIGNSKKGLIDIALKRLIDEVSRRKAGKRKSTDQLSLFAEYKNIPQTVAIGGRTRKRTAKLSISEASAYLESISPKAVSDQYEAFKKLVEDCLMVSVSGEETLEVLIQRKRNEGSK